MGRTCGPQRRSGAGNARSRLCEPGSWGRRRGHSLRMHCIGRRTTRRRCRPCQRGRSHWGKGGPRRGEGKAVVGEIAQGGCNWPGSVLPHGEVPAPGIRLAHQTPPGLALPLRLGGEAVHHPGLPGEPCAEGLGVVPSLPPPPAGWGVQVPVLPIQGGGVAGSLEKAGVLGVGWSRWRPGKRASGSPGAARLRRHSWPGLHPGGSPTGNCRRGCGRNGGPEPQGSPGPGPGYRWAATASTGGEPAGQYCGVFHGGRLGRLLGARAVPGS